MKAFLKGNAYKYWIYGSIDAELHIIGCVDVMNGVTIDGIEVRPNDICEDFTYCEQAFSILKCCGTGSVVLHVTVDDEEDIDWVFSATDYDTFIENGMATIVPPEETNREEFEAALFELFDVAPFEIWDGDVNTCEVSLS